MRLSYPPVLLAFFSGLLLSAAWYWNLTPLAFVGWVPLLFMERQINESQGAKKRLRLWAYSYLCFFIWNLLVTWWIVYASFGGACMAILANALLMSMVFLLYSALKQHVSSGWSHWILLPLWLAWEHLHGLWDLSWTWLNLGNVFAFQHTWIQWYEFTGASGGSAWILSVNLLLFALIRNNEGNLKTWRILPYPILAIALPILLSLLILHMREPLQRKQKPLSCLIVQPNVDPYNSKFVLDYRQQFLNALKLIRSKLEPGTEYIVLPETFVTSDINEELLNKSEELQWFRDSLMRSHPQLKIITGGNTYAFYKDAAKITATARFDHNSGLYYDYYNSAIYIDRDTCEVYHKSRLVPGVEKMPFPALLKPLEKLALNLGGTVGSLGLQDERSVFGKHRKASVLAPVICYESVYADYLSAYVRNGAQWICIVTNDGWWEDTPGYKQHMQYARLRAIENRRQIARSANTGISCFIDEFGNSYGETAWWQEAVITGGIYPNTQLSFFSRYGDLLSRGAVLLSAALLLFAVLRRLALTFGRAKQV